jgi:signal transduction histidine kinase
MARVPLLSDVDRNGADPLSGPRVQDVVVKPALPQRRKTYSIHIAVRDTGIGIPADRMDRLFKSFSQVIFGLLFDEATF